MLIAYPLSARFDTSNYKDNDILSVSINDKNLSLLIAKSNAARAKGLGERVIIPKDGMIFFFENPQRLIFWMKGMFFSIDIVWISDDRIVGFVESAKPEIGISDANLKRYSSPSNADTVIELKNGAVKDLGIKVGDKIIIENSNKSAT
jgi:uncharacterized membrane protein (UPF0127 family)